MGERSVREPGSGEVRIAVRAAAVNPTDIGLRESGGGPDLPPPWVAGMDAAGQVEAVGDGVQRLAAGDLVMAAVSPRRPEGGAQSELLVVPEWLDELRELAAAGRLRLRVAAEYPPERAADAQRAMAAGGLRGRAVIVF